MSEPTPLPTFSDFQATLTGSTLDGWTTDPWPIYKVITIGEDTKLIIPTCSETSSYHTAVPYPPCPDRLCAQNDPYQGYWHYVIRDVVEQNETSYDINFFYYQNYGSRVFDTDECTLSMSATEMTVTCEKDNTRIDKDRTIKTLYSGLKAYQDVATNTHECRME
ncbi:hypothetical protein KKF63_00310 [bacterium]|nr:hypothetical protein [bacterium]